MSVVDQLPPDYIMKEMAKLASEQATQSCAAFARAFAGSVKGLDGHDALMAFARAIESTNSKVWPKGVSR